MARYEVLKSSKDKETNEVFHQGTTIDKTINILMNTNLNLKRQGMNYLFFKRLDK
ncbi:hypothetical protein [Staphylococcus chromogenes]|uniref:hypothetical protein n=1 Tax=Staphylococcus chromogenes TaxID=46126 RepID=UPI0016458E1C|nr:hypothetical protein [Staphylococcus chromogenes]